MLTNDDVRQAHGSLAEGLRGWLASRGLDPDDDRLVETPMRVQRVLDELTSGYDEDPAIHLARTFTAEDHQGMIAVSEVAFTSLCERHLMPFAGHATIAYVPADGAQVVGLSKLPRVLDVYSRRLQVQQRLARQVTEAIDTHLKTQGSACILRAHHACMPRHGVQEPSTMMVTSILTGCFDADAALRGELQMFEGYESWRRGQGLGG